MNTSISPQKRKRYTYTATIDGIDLIIDGEIVSMTPNQAKYYLKCKLANEFNVSFREVKVLELNGFKTTNEESLD